MVPVPRPLVPVIRPLLTDSSHLILAIEPLLLYILLYVNCCSAFYENVSVCKNLYVQTNYPCTGKDLVNLCKPKPNQYNKNLNKKKKYQRFHEILIRLQKKQQKLPFSLPSIHDQNNIFTYCQNHIHTNPYLEAHTP